MQQINDLLQTLLQVLSHPDGKELELSSPSLMQFTLRTKPSPIDTNRP